MKKCVSMILTVAMFMNATAFAEIGHSNDTEKYYTYNNSGEKVVLFYYYLDENENAVITEQKQFNGTVDIEIPSEIEGHPVTEVTCSFPRTSAYLVDWNRIERLVIPDGVKKINIDAKDCHNLREIILPDSIDDISGTCFKETAISEISIPDKITAIPNAFCQGCENLKSITISDNVTSIGSYAFANCTSLSSVHIGKNVESIGEKAFSTTAITEIDLPDGLKELRGFDNCEGLTSVHVPDTVKELDAFAECKNLKEANIPDGVKILGGFRSTKISNIKIPDGVTKICDYCFQYTDITEAKIPNSVETLGKSAFSGCTSLKKASIPKGLISAPSTAFKECRALTDVTINEPMNRYLYEALIETPWIKTYEDSVDGGFVIFDNCLVKYSGSDRNPVIPDSVKTLGEYAFRAVDIDGVTFSPSITEIPTMSFAFSRIKELHVPSTIKRIGEMAFYGCDELEKITVDEGVESIASRAFINCYKLLDENVSIDKSVRVSVDAFKQTPMDKEFIESGQWIDGFATPKPDAPASPAPTSSPQHTDAPIVAAAADKLSVHGGDEITVAVNDKAVIFSEEKPFVDENGRTQVPIRAVADMLDCEVDWNDTSKTAVITNTGGNVVTLTLGSDVMTVNGKQTKMDTAATIKDDRTYIPVRFAAEALGLEVEWVE